MRSGRAAAIIILTSLLAWPAAAEPVDHSTHDSGSPGGAAAAAAAAVRGAKSQSPAETAGPAAAQPQAGQQQQAAVPDPTTSTPPPSDAKPETAAATSGAPAASGPSAARDEAPAEAGASPDAPPATTAAIPETKPAATAPAEPPESAKPKLIAAKTLFGAAKEPAPMAARAIGTYARGCLAGAKPLAVDGATWQAMRLSRNRTWGHPDLIALLERFAGEVKEDGWPGLLVGDLSQPRGGPMLTGHASHQLGLDADIWFTPMPDHRLSKKERETLSATSMLSSDSLSVDPKVWTQSRVNIIKRVASYSKVERVLVHPAIKKALCEGAGSENRAWLNKVRPYWGHFYHFHVRIGCPAGSEGCRPQAAVPGDDGCGKELDDWFKLLTRKPKPRPPGELPKVVVKPKPKAPVTLDDLPGECRTVLATGSDIKLPPPAVAAKPERPAILKAGATAAPKAAEKPVAKPAAAKPAPAVKDQKKAAPTKAAAAKAVEKTKKE